MATGSDDEMAEGPARSKTSDPNNDGVSDVDLATCMRVLEQLRRHPERVDEREPLERCVAAIYKRTRKERRKQSAEVRRASDRRLVEGVLSRREPGRAGAATAPAPGDLTLRAGTRGCYACGARFSVLGARYHLLCPPCAALNESKRGQRARLDGRRALVTGGRIKIGFELCLKLLRDGADVVMTTRDADGARDRFAREPDFAVFHDRLHVCGLDLRDMAAVEDLGRDFLRRFGPLDILVHNAAQSVVRPPGVDDAGDDGREVNSWTLRLEEVDAGELRDALIINAAAPLLLTGRLLPALRRSAHADRYVVSVVGLDGQFRRPYKSARHPHVNASKAALHMMTRTCAEEWAAQGIYACSVDPGWVTHEGSHASRERARAQGFAPPLDAVDAAARIYDPIVMGVGGRPSYGLLYKDYAPAPF
jgi:NAD(P)-dependent dehydrogenase (short-subunit alcohol dehydrogenase family)